MSLSKLAIALLVIFGVFTVALIGEYLYVVWRRRSFRHRSSPAPPIRGDVTRNLSIYDTATKELMYFFRLKPVTDVELDPHEPPVKDIDESSAEEEVVDVFKLEEVTRLSRFLSTIKEEDKEESESTPDVDFSIKPVEVEEEDEVAVTVDEDDGHAKTVFSTPCDSPVFLTPVGSPLRGVIESPVFVVSDHETGDRDERQ